MARRNAPKRRISTIGTRPPCHVKHQRPITSGGQREALLSSLAVKPRSNQPAIDFNLAYLQCVTTIHGMSMCVWESAKTKAARHADVACERGHWATNASRSARIG